MATLIGERAVVLSSADGKPLREYQTGNGGWAEILQLSNQGVPLIGNSDGVLKNGVWHTVRTDENGLVVPLTPDFHAQCGPVFRDRVMAELGVVERRPIDDRARKAARTDLSRDGRFMMVPLGYMKGTDIIEVASGHVLMHVDQGAPEFTLDGRSVIATDEAGGLFKLEPETGKRAWTLFVNRKHDGFYMIFADGHVRYSKTPSLDFALVRGFEVRSFDGAAAKQFIAPPGADDAP